MHADDDAPATTKKKSDSPNDNLVVNKLDGHKKPDKSETEDPKPRIVLTFRSEKPGAKSSNMKIVSNEEKHEEFSPRRSSRTRAAKWEWEDEAETSISSKRDKSRPVSETDDASDSSHTTPKRSTRRRSKDSSDNVLANAIARKEKSYNETSAPTQRLSRRIKPTAKILANEELRIGLESQNNARLGITPEKSPEEGVRTRRSARPVAMEVDTSRDTKQKSVAMEMSEESKETPESSMKLKHLSELGLKALTPEANDEESGDAENSKPEAEVIEDEEIDDDTEVINKLLEADEESDTSDSDFYCSEEASQSERPRRSTRLYSSYGPNESSNEQSEPVVDDDQKVTTRRSSRRAAKHGHIDDTERSSRQRRKRNRSECVEEPHSEPEPEENSNPAGGEEGEEAACPSEESRIIATCYCETPSNVYAAPAELTEPVFCQAIEMVDDVRVGCSHAARKDPDGSYCAMVRAGPRAPYFMACQLHTKQLRKHMCCPACGLFCSQGIFYQCSEGHFFHLDCGLPYNDAKLRTGCPHCGVHSYRWQPVNRDCSKVKIQMNCSNKMIFLPDQREQCTPAYLSFTTPDAAEMDQAPMIPEDLLPSPAIDLKQLTAKAADITTSPQELCEAILAGETVEQLIPKIASCSEINAPLSSMDGGTCVHAACRRGHLAALHALHAAAAHIDAVDAHNYTALILTLTALLDKSEKKFPEKTKTPEADHSEEMEVDQSTEEKEKEIQEEVSEKKKEDDKPSDEDLIKIVRYLIAVGCDLNAAGPEGLTALHVSAQHGSVAMCSALLNAGANVDPKDHGGWTPLVWAAENKHANVVRLLLTEGADAVARDSEGNSVVHWCALAGDAASLRALLRADPKAAHVTNAHADTPLHVAARQGHYACVLILLARGAKTDVENSAGELPVDVCKEHCQSAIYLNMQMKHAVKDKDAKYKLLSSDISNGREAFPIPCVNEVDDEPLPDDFTYVTQHVTPQHINIDNTMQTMQGCSCADGSCSATSCSCCALGVRAWVSRGHLLPDFPYHDPPMLFECNALCACNAKKCENRLISNALRSGAMFVRAQVFRCSGSVGWGLRAAPGAPGSGAVRRGAPVAAYCGELLPLATADTRPKDQYMFALEVKNDLLQQCSEKTPLCVDAAVYGSAARFINHSCRPNLAPLRVFTNTRDLRLPTVALVATRNIHPGEEFTFDYGDKFWSVKSKWMKCECGSSNCRYSNTEESVS